METTLQQRIEVLEEVIALMDECAEKLRSLHDRRIEAYCLAALEGSQRGCLGKFERDYVEEELKAARQELQEGEEETD